MFHVPERYRINGQPGRYRINGNPGLPFSTTAADGNNGVFEWRKGHLAFRAIASDGSGWEHVSVSVWEIYKGRRAPRMASWDEMCEVKALFWDDEDVVVQYHPRKSEYVKNVSYVLHLWAPTEAIMPTPPPIMVGFVEQGELV